MVITDKFLDEVGTQLTNLENTNLTYVAVGTGSATPVSTGTDLNAELDRKARQEITINTEEDTTVVSMFIGSTEDNNETINEVGTFDDASTGTMYNHSTFTNIDKDSTKEVWIDVINVSDVQEDA